MKKAKSFITALSLLFLGGFSAEGLADETEIIDNIEIIAIKSMEIPIGEDTALNLVVRMENRNQQTVKITNPNFSFFLFSGDSDLDSVKLTNDKLIGTDNKQRDIILHPLNNLSGGYENQFNDIHFNLKLPKNEQDPCKSLKRILNAIGNPRKMEPLFFIVGKFSLGIESEKGWTYIPVSIEWGLKPYLEKEVLLEANPIVNIDIPSNKGEIEEIIDNGEGDSGGGIVISIPDFHITLSMLIKSIENIINYDYDPANPDRLVALINFNYDSSEIMKSSYPLLDDYAAILKEPKFGNLVMAIVGHASSEGSEEYNQALSEKRAASVKEYFINNHNIDQSRLFDFGQGESKPIATNSTEIGKKLNRRVEFFLFSVPNPPEKG